MPIRWLKCEEALRLLSDSKDGQASFFERFSLKIHLWVCKNCPICRNHLQFIQRLLKRLPASQAAGQEEKLSDAAKLRIKQKMEKNG